MALATVRAFAMPHWNWHSVITD